MVLPDLNFTPPEEDDVHISEGEHAGTLSTAKQSYSFKYIKLSIYCRYIITEFLTEQADMYSAWYIASA
jgi:hypothetical protein